MLKGLGDLAKMGSMVSKALEVKAKIEELKETLANERISASSGGGMVRVELNGKMQVLSLYIDPALVNPEEKEVLETLVQAALNDGVQKVQDLLKQRMSEVAGGLDIPGLT